MERKKFIYLLAPTVVLLSTVDTHPGSHDHPIHSPPIGWKWSKTLLYTWLQRHKGHAGVYISQLFQSVSIAKSNLMFTSKRHINNKRVCTTNSVKVATPKNRYFWFTNDLKRCGLESNICILLVCFSAVLLPVCIFLVVALYSSTPF